MNILTDEEIANMSVDCALASPSDICFARKLESAILAKLAEGQEAVAWVEHHKGGDNLVWEQGNWCSSPLYLHPSAELAALRAEVEQLKEECEELYAKLSGRLDNWKCEQLAAAQFREQQMREALANLDNYVSNNLSSDYPTGIDVTGKEFCASEKALALPADRSALDAYLAPYKLDAERYRWLKERNYMDGKTVALECFVIESTDLFPKFSDEEFDEAIDAAIAAAKEK